MTCERDLKTAVAEAEGPEKQRLAAELAAVAQELDEIDADKKSKAADLKESQEAAAARAAEHAKAKKREGPLSCAKAARNLSKLEGLGDAVHEQYVQACAGNTTHGETSEAYRAFYKCIQHADSKAEVDEDCVPLNPAGSPK